MQVKRHKRGSRRRGEGRRGASSSTSSSSWEMRSCYHGWRVCSSLWWIIVGFHNTLRPVRLLFLQPNDCSSPSERLGSWWIRFCDISAVVSRFECNFRPWPGFIGNPDMDCTFIVEIVKLFRQSRNFPTFHGYFVCPVDRCRSDMQRGGRRSG